MHRERFHHQGQLRQQLREGQARGCLQRVRGHLECGPQLLGPLFLCLGAWAVLERLHERPVQEVPAPLSPW